MGKIIINGKNIKTISVGGKTIKTLTVGGKTLTLSPPAPSNAYIVEPNNAYLSDTFFTMEKTSKFDLSILTNGNPFYIKMKPEWFAFTIADDSYTKIGFSDNGLNANGRIEMIIYFPDDSIYHDEPNLSWKRFKGYILSLNVNTHNTVWVKFQFIGGKVRIMGAANTQP